MPDPVSMRKQQALSIRSALETLHGGALEQYRVSRLRMSPEVSVAEAVDELAARLVKLEGMANKFAIRAAKLEAANEKLEERLSKLEQKAKPRPRKPRAAEE
jgi:DNA repair ATPase RecN